MLKLLETIKDSAESTFDSAASRVENVHRLISGYVGGQARRLRGRNSVTDADDPARPPHGARNSGDAPDQPSIYDVIRGVNREIGEFGTDVFEIIDDARARRTAEKRDRRDASDD